MDFIYARFYKKRRASTTLAFLFIIPFLDCQVNGQALNQNSEEFSRNTLAAYVIVSGLGVGITILFLCYLYVRAQLGCCCFKRKSTSQDLQTINTANTTSAQIYSGVVHPSSSGLQGGNAHNLEMDNLDTGKLGQEEEDPPPSYESVVGIAFKV